MHFVVACPSETVHLHHLLCVCDTCVLCAAHDGTYNQWTPGGPWYYYAMGYGTCKQGQDKCHAPCGYGYSWIGVWKSDTMVSAFFLSFAHIIFQCSNLSTDVDEAKRACNAPLCPRPARSRVLAPPAPLFSLLLRFIYRYICDTATTLRGPLLLYISGQQHLELGTGSAGRQLVSLTTLSLAPFLPRTC